MSKIKTQLLPLKNQKAFNKVSEHAVKYICRYFIISSSPITPAFQNLTSKKIDNARLPVYCGFKISRKYGKAHERNLLKRRIKNMLHFLFPQIALDMSFIFIPRIPVKNLEYKDLYNELEKTLNWLAKKHK